MKKRVLFLCSGSEGPSDLLLLAPLLEALQSDAYEIDYIAPEGFTLNHTLRKVSWKSSSTLYGLRWLFQTFVLPFLVARHCISTRYDAVVSSDPYLLFVTWPTTLITFVQRILILQHAPWMTRKRQQRFVLTRHILAFQDFLGMLSASVILVPSTATRQAISAVASLLEKKVMQLPVSRSCVRYEDIPPEDILEAERGEVLERYDISERSVVFGASIAEASFKEAERCLRLFNALPESRKALFLFGQNIEQNSLVSISIGLGLTEQVFFVEIHTEERLVCPHIDVYFLLSEMDETSYSLCLARANQALIVPVRVILDEQLEKICATVLDGRISHDSKKLSELLQSKERFRQQSRVQQEEESWVLEDWGLRARQVVGL